MESMTTFLLAILVTAICLALPGPRLQVVPIRSRHRQGSGSRNAN